MGKKENDAIKNRQIVSALQPKHLPAPDSGTYKEVISCDVPIYHGGKVVCHIYEPNISGPLNTLFFTHGTAFTASASDIDDNIGLNLCVALKCRVISVFHKLAPENKYPYPYNDVVAVINHFLQQTEIDLGKIGLGGYSSGALLALLIWLKAAKSGHKISFSQLLLLAPPVDLQAIVEMQDIPELEKIKLEFFKKFVENFLPPHIKPYFSEVSPAANKDSILKLMPRCSIVVGKHDGIYKSVHQFIERLERLGVTINTIENPEWCHTFPWEETNYIADLSDFVMNAFRYGKVNDVRKIGLLPIISFEPQIVYDRGNGFGEYTETIEIRPQIVITAQEKEQERQLEEFREECRQAKSEVAMKSARNSAGNRYNMFSVGSEEPSWQDVVYLRPERNRLFVESFDPEAQTTYLKRVHASLQREHVLTITQRELSKFENMKCVVSGLGGIGKTQLATEYAYAYEHEYQLICWVDAETAEGIIAAYRALLEAMDLDSSVKNPLKELNKNLKNYGRCLFIYDNVEDSSALMNIKPVGVDILVTSRNRDWQQQLELGVYQEDESVDYLFKATGQERSEQSLQNAKLVARELGNLPLALAQAAGYIRAGRISFASYLKRFQDNQKKLMQSRVDKESGYQFTVDNTWNLTISRIKELYSAETVDAILAKCAFLSPDNIPVELFNGADDEIISTLNDYSMLKKYETPDGRAVFSMHRLVQAVMAERTRFLQPTIISDLIMQMINLYPLQKKNDADYRLSRLLVSHLVCLHDKFLKLDQANERSIENDKLLELLADAYEVLGDSEKQIATLQQLLQLRQDQYAITSSEIINVKRSLAAAYGRLGNYKERYRILEAALKDLESEKGEVVVNTLVDLAITCGKIGEYQRRVNLLERALALQIEQKGENDPLALKIKGNLANAYAKLGENVKRKDLLIEVMNGQKTLYGENGFQLAKTYKSLGNAYGKLDEQNERQKYLLQAYEIQKTALGETHQKTTKILNNIANNWGSLGDQEKRINCLCEVKKAYPADHPRQAKIDADLGRAYCKLGKYDDGIKLMLKAIEMLKQHFGPNHTKLVKISLDLAEVYLQQEAPFKAQELVKQAEAILTASKENKKVKGLLQTVAKLQDQINTMIQGYDKDLAIKEQNEQSVTPNLTSGNI